MMVLGGGISLFGAFVGGFCLIGFLFYPVTNSLHEIYMTMPRAILLLLISSFIFIVFAKKLHQLLYILVPISFVLAFWVGILIEEWLHRGYFTMVCITILFLFPFSTLKLITKHYKTKCGSLRDVILNQDK